MALLAWLLASTTSTLAQIVLIWLCTAPISALHFRHSIVGSIEAFVGNAVGGVLLVALLNHSQVKADRDG